MSAFDPVLLRQAREKAGLTQTTAAALVGRCYSTLVKYERGEFAPSAATLARLADAYAVTVSAFFTDAAHGGVR